MIARLLDRIGLALLIIYVAIMVTVGFTLALLSCVVAISVALMCSILRVAEELVGLYLEACRVSLSRFSLWKRLKS